MTEVFRNFDSLLNIGIVIGNVDSKAQKFRKESVVVLGTGRGGTSMISGVLHHMGIFMGERANPPVYEDVALSTALENQEEEKIRRLVDSYSSKYDLWGFKRPSALFHLCKIEALFPAPKYVVIFKDILSIANRNHISMRLDVFSGLERALSDYGQIIEFLRMTDRPYMLVSYDKILSNPEQFINALMEFLPWRPDEEQYAQALKFISPNPIEYIDKSRITKAMGRIDMVQQTSVSGWAKYVYRSEPATVVLFINGKETKRAIANLYREGLKKQGIHPSGHCAFCFDLTDVPLGPDDEVRVRVIGEVSDLKNSPASFVCDRD